MAKTKLPCMGTIERNVYTGDQLCKSTIQKGNIRVHSKIKEDPNKRRAANYRCQLAELIQDK